MATKSKKDKLFSPIEAEGIRAPARIVKDIKPPSVLRPGVDWDNLSSEITSEPLDSPNPDWDKILSRWGYDPAYYEMMEPVKVSQWDVQAEGGVKTLWSYKAGVRTRSFVKDSGYEDLVSEIKKYRKPKKLAPSGSDAFVVCLSDFQMGKADGDGVKGTIQRILTMVDSVEDRVHELRKIDRKLGKLVVAGLGDMIENCSQQYPSQEFTVELNRREQIRVCRRLIRDAIVRWSKHFQEVDVVAVGGNHGENRKDGKIFTTRGDNDDIAIFEMVAEILAANKEAFGHVRFFLPEDELYLVMDICGTRVGFFHGHLTSGAGTPQQKLRRWWEGQTFGEESMGDARILITGHYHHLSIVEYGKKIHIQCPSMESTSQWWVDLKGENSRPGTVTFVLDADGYKDFALV